MVSQMHEICFTCASAHGAPGELLKRVALSKLSRLLPVETVFNSARLLVSMRGGTRSFDKTAATIASVLIASPVIDKVTVLPLLDFLLLRQY